MTSICIRGERGKRHSRSKSSEHGRTTGGASTAPTGNGSASILGIKNSTLGRDNVLASIISATTVNSNTSANSSAGVGGADQLPLTRPIAEKKRSVLGPLGECVSSSKPRVQGMSRHPRTLSRSARAVKSSENAVSKVKPSSAVRRSAGGHSRKNGGMHSSRGSLTRGNIASEHATSRTGMGASAPTNMMGSLPRPHRRGGAPGPSEDSRLLDARPISEQGGAPGVRTSVRRSRDSAKKRGVYDKARYSDGIESNGADAHGNERKSDRGGDVSASDTVGITRKRGAPTGYGNGNDADDDSIVARIEVGTSREGALHGSVNDSSVTRCFTEHEQSAINVGTVHEHSIAPPPPPLVASTRNASGGVMPILPQNKLESVSADFDDVPTATPTAATGTNAAFDFHSRPRALSASRTLEPLSHSSKNQTSVSGITRNHHRGEATTSEKNTIATAPEGDAANLRGVGQQQQQQDDVLRWAKKMNRINSGSRSRDGDMGVAANNRSELTIANALSSSMDAWYGVKDGASDVDGDLQNSVANECAQFSSGLNQHLRHESVLPKSAASHVADPYSISSLGVTGETKVDDGDKFPASTVAASVETDRTEASHAMDGVTHETTHQHASSSFELSETFSNGADFAASNFHAAYLSRAFTPPVFLKKDTIAPPTVDGDGDEEYYYNHFPDPPPSAPDDDAASSSTTTTKNGSGALDLMFDPILNCYFDPKTTLYYELRR